MYYCADIQYIRYYVTCANVTLLCDSLTHCLVLMNINKKITGKMTDLL